MSNTVPQYPYLPEGRSIEYVSDDNAYMIRAREVAIEQSLDKALKTGAVVVSGEVIIGEGANGSTYHETNECERVKQNIPTGQGYELCEGCHPKNHAEASAIEDAKAKGHEADLEGSSLYLWGHWWCCEPCWNAMEAAGIARVYLLEKSETLFNREDPANILKTAYV